MTEQRHGRPQAITRQVLKHSSARAMGGSFWVISRPGRIYLLLVLRSSYWSFPAPKLNVSCSWRTVPGGNPAARGAGTGPYTAWSECKWTPITANLLPSTPSSAASTGQKFRSRSCARHEHAERAATLTAMDAFTGAFQFYIEPAILRYRLFRLIATLQYLVKN